jgi:hypothetical protein
MVKNACPKCRKNAPTGNGKNIDTPGASPRRSGAPVAIMFNHLDRISGTTMESHAPPPQGAGLAQGGGANGCQSQKSGAGLALYPPKEGPMTFPILPAREHSSSHRKSRYFGVRVFPFHPVPAGKSRMNAFVRCLAQPGRPEAHTGRNLRCRHRLERPGLRM